MLREANRCAKRCAKLRLAGSSWRCFATRRLLIRDNFSPQASGVRALFDGRMAEPLGSVDVHRFTWDYWHVPSKYSLLRTPADQYFEDSDEYAKLQQSLLEFGERELGISDELTSSSNSYQKSIRLPQLEPNVAVKLYTRSSARAACRYTSRAVGMGIVIIRVELETIYWRRDVDAQRHCSSVLVQCQH